jgi:ribosomal protein L32E
MKYIPLKKTQQRRKKEFKRQKQKTHIETEDKWAKSVRGMNCDLWEPELWAEILHDFF